MTETDENYIDNLFDEIDDPIIDNFNAIGMLEGLIWSSLFDNETKKDMLSKTETLRSSEFNEMVSMLKENQNIRDPKDQLKQMIDNGVFK